MACESQIGEKELQRSMECGGAPVNEPLPEPDEPFWGVQVGLELIGIALSEYLLNPSS